VIALGFEIGSGLPISVPVGHTVFLGATQRAGKTTALEAAAIRSGYRCLAFITKRGEGSFRMAIEVPPYYQETVDWRSIKALCEALTEEKYDKFQRQCLRSVCRAGQSGRPGGKLFAEWTKPENLEDVQRNVKIALSKATGQREMIFGELQDDLAITVEELAKLRKSSIEPKLQPGLNVVSLEHKERHIQSLVVSSMIRWTREHGQGTIIALPETWKFAPSNRRTPVGDAAREFIREGAALQNFLWIDSQTLGGLNSELLSQVRVWLFGVQRLRAEIEKTLDAIPDSLYPRPRAADIQTLKLGEFIVCFDESMYRVYVWPAWMKSQLHAQAIAMGEESVESAREIAREFDEERTGS
jgi:hypothetical protein